MFDKEQKEAFIKEYLKSKVVAKTSLYAVFRKTEPFEDEYNKDVSDFSGKEILAMLSKFKSKATISLLNYCIVLKIENDKTIISGNAMCIKIVKAS